MFALFNHGGKQTHEEIDLIGLTQTRAVTRTREQLTKTEDALKSGKLLPNLNNRNHIFKVIAHAGKHSEKDKGPKLKFAVKEAL